MRLLLPPSEAKNPGGRGRPLAERPDASALGRARATARQGLSRLIGGDPELAARALLLPGAVAEQALARDAAVDTSPTMAAVRRYCGVLYHGLGYEDLPADVQRAAHRHLLIFSGLFGVVRGDELIPDYRVPGKAVLPGVGVVGTFWRPHLEALLAGPGGRHLIGRGLIVDLRSGDYAAMWRPRAPVADRTLTVRVLSPLPRGGHGVISFNSKLGKGRLAAALLSAIAAGHEPRSADDVAQAWLGCGGHSAQPTGRGLDLYTA